MDGFLSGGSVRVRIDRRAIAVKRNLLLNSNDLEFSVAAVFASNKSVRPPVELLTWIVKDDQPSL